MDLKPNTGVAFKNDKKGNDKAPEYKGEIDVNGELKQIALWVSKSQKGVSYFSIKISEPYTPQAQQPQSDQSGLPESDDLSEPNLPF